MHYVNVSGFFIIFGNCYVSVSKKNVFYKKKRLIKWIKLSIVKGKTTNTKKNGFMSLNLCCIKNAVDGCCFYYLCQTQYHYYVNVKQIKSDIYRENQVFVDFPFSYRYHREINIIFLNYYSLFSISCLLMSRYTR